MASRSITCDENMIVKMPTATSTSVTNNPKLSPEITPKLAVLPFHRTAAETAAPIRPTMPRPPTGPRSPGSRNASQAMQANAASVTDNIGTIASNAGLIILSAIQNAKCKMQTRHCSHDGPETRSDRYPAVAWPQRHFRPDGESAATHLVVALTRSV